MLVVLGGPGQGIVVGTCESQVKVNWVDAGLDFLEACCRILTFSCPRAGVIGIFAAFAEAIDSDIIPVVSTINMLVNLYDREDGYRLTGRWPLSLSLFSRTSISPITCSI